MRLDYELATRNLTRSLEMLEASAARNRKPPELVAQMYSATRLLFDDPIISPITGSVVADFTRQHTDARKQVWSNDIDTKRLAREIAESIKVLAEKILVASEEDQTKKMSPMANAQRILEALGQIQPAHADASHVPPNEIAASINDSADRLNEFITEGGDWFEGHKALTAATTEKMRELKIRVQETNLAAMKFEALVEAVSLNKATSHLRNFHDWMAGAVQNEHGGKEVRSIPDADDLKENLLSAVRQIGSGVLHRVSAEVGVAHALRRMKVFFEHFGKEETIRELRASPGKHEARLQEAFDRFLWEEGAFPITHCTVAEGEADTLAFVGSELSPRLNAADESASPPVLVELKQAVAFDDGHPTEAALRSKTEKALGQARIYTAHLASNARWRHLRLHAVLFYTGHQRFETDRDDVQLVYLGDKSPHHAAKLLKIAG